VLEISQFRASPRHAPLTLSVRAGEIIGIAGLMGSGRTELLEALYGVRTPLSGTVSVNNAGGRCGGLALLPESRKEQALFESFSIAQTISLASTRGTSTLSSRALAQEHCNAERWIRDLSIHCQGPEQVALTLSGGNQQKVVLGRCLASSPRVLLLDEPTRGVDIGARQSIYRILLQLAEQGLAIIFVSSELEEVLGLSDRILVMNSGYVAGILERPHATEHSIMRLAAAHAEDPQRAA
jgi:ribose transport system ATP-binding protein